MRYTCRKMTSADRMAAACFFSQAVGRQFPWNMLPLTGVAAVPENSDVPDVVLIVYFEQSCPVAVLGFCAFNPAASAKSKLDAAHAAMLYSIKYCREAGRTHLLSMFGERALNRIADAIGFVSADNLVQEKYFKL